MRREMAIFMLVGSLGACGGLVAANDGSSDDGSFTGGPNAIDAGANFDASVTIVEDAAVSSILDSGEKASVDAGPDAGPLLYRLASQTSSASPTPNACGITYDGEDLWILASSGNPQPYILERVDPATLAVDRSFTLASLFSTLGTAAFGIAWDGSSIWISIAGDTNALVVVDPTTGEITRTIGSPTEVGPSDLDFDGTDLWLSSGSSDAYRIATTNGGVVKHFGLSVGVLRDNGIAFRPGELFVGDLFGGMEVYDPASGTPLGSVTHDDGSSFTQSEIGPSVFVGDNLVMLSSLGITTYETIKVVP
jgi:hypothetical protein